MSETTSLYTPSRSAFNTLCSCCKAMISTNQKTYSRQDGDRVKVICEACFNLASLANRKDPVVTKSLKSIRIAQYWAKMTPEERSAEMAHRRGVPRTTRAIYQKASRQAYSAPGAIQTLEDLRTSLRAKLDALEATITLLRSNAA
jgi:hypothetical protein